MSSEKWHIVHMFRENIHWYHDPKGQSLIVVVT